MEENKMKKLLIVEDNIIAAEMNKLTCEAHFECQIANEGVSGKALLPWADCVLVDGRFPNASLFYTALKESGKPFVVYSGTSTCAGVGELAFVLKPDLLKLKQAIKLLLP
jgi:hypothetical protein